MKLKLPNWLKGDGPPAPRMPLDPIKEHERYDYQGAGKFLVYTSPAKQKLIDDRMRAALSKLTAASEAAAATFAATKAAAKKAYDAALANAQPIRDKAIAAAEDAYETERNEIARWSVVPATPEEIAAFVTAATPHGAVVHLTEESAQALAKPGAVKFTPVSSAP